ncbi:MAG TPA: glycosyl hydrolase family 18 protein [Candidatus Paceibacterota bacterium]|nr:glycosyl hydrolase family 18 protein [Candidatus Magasanikbacteria bacterium]HPW34569.1 glycosyl hydrolase family 18 protein [Candidatus Paceibacterota bacterium]
MKTTLPKTIVGIIILAAILSPALSFAADLKYGAWLPFWKKQSGAETFALQMEKFDEISPFSYEIKSDGSLIDSLKMKSGFWPQWIKAVQDAGVKVMPSIALLDGDKVHALLSDSKLRTKHINNIVKLVKDNKYDGIDIDYEDKWAKTKPYFNSFIKELWKKLPWSKTLSCTIESRTPLESRFKVVPEKMEYANDYPFLNQYCDEIRIMAYDQGNIDIKISAQKGENDFYMPVADKDWVEKVIKETIKTINRKKIMLGIPTYGYEYEVSWNDGITTYKRLRSRTFTQAIDLANSVGVTPKRNSAGELSFVYASSTPIEVSKNLTYKIASLISPANIVPSPKITRFVNFSDAQSAENIISLAKKYGLKGVIFFKMDGETDPKLWDKIK